MPWFTQICLICLTGLSKPLSILQWKLSPKIRNALKRRSIDTLEYVDVIRGQFQTRIEHTIRTVLFSEKNLLFIFEKETRQLPRPVSSQGLYRSSRTALSYLDPQSFGNRNWTRISSELAFVNQKSPNSRQHKLRMLVKVLVKLDASELMRTEVTLSFTSLINSDRRHSFLMEKRNNHLMFIARKKWQEAKSSGRSA
jgi:hypothetical protein